MKKQLRYLLLVSLISLSTLYCNSRVAFSRPGALMRLSTFSAYNADQLFSLAMASEITSLGDIMSHSSIFSVSKTNINGSTWGFSYGLLPYAGTDLQGSSDAAEIGFHYQKKIYSAGKTNVTAGIHDFILNDDQNIALKDLSLFVNFSNSVSSGEYLVTTMLGIGSGRLANDPHTTYSSSSSLGIFGAFKLNTPFLSKWGGMDFITEFAHAGLNLGLSLPISQEYKISFGVTHIENLSDLNNQSEGLELSKEGAAICIGLTINLPKIRSSQKLNSQQTYPLLFINGAIDSSLYNAGEYIYFLQDSLEILKQQVNNISATNVKLRLDNNNYQDSLNNLIFSSNINSTNHNAAMRHLSQSLRLYYQGDFTQALDEVEKAILLQPKTAMAYARKGSIYYKLNQLDRATLNWNIALKLDPEYQEVRAMLNALKNNKLRPLSSEQ
jgi:regulator of replication initiation timing